MSRSRADGLSLQFTPALIDADRIGRAQGRSWERTIFLPLQSVFLGNPEDSEDSSNVYMQTPTPNEDDGLVQTKLEEFNALLDEVCAYTNICRRIRKSHLG